MGGTIVCRNHSHMVVYSHGNIEVQGEQMLMIETEQPCSLETLVGGKLTFDAGLHLLIPAWSLAASLRSVQLATGEHFDTTSASTVNELANMLIRALKLRQP